MLTFWSENKHIVQTLVPTLVTVLRKSSTFITVVCSDSNGTHCDFRLAARDRVYFFAFGLQFIWVPWVVDSGQVWMRKTHSVSRGQWGGVGPTTVTQQTRHACGHGASRCVRMGHSLCHRPPPWLHSTTTTTDVDMYRNLAQNPTYLRLNVFESLIICTTSRKPRSDNITWRDSTSCWVTMMLPFFPTFSFFFLLNFHPPYTTTI